MRKRLLAVGVTLAMVLSLVACGGSKEETKADTTAAETEAAKGETEAADTTAAGDEETKAPAASGTGYKIGYSTNSLDEVQTKSSNAFIEYAESLGHEVILLNADGSCEKQISDIESFIQQGCDAVVIRAVDTEGLSGVVEDCKNAGVAVIDFGFGINAVCDLHLMTDAYKYCSNQSVYLKDYLDKNPDAELKIGYIWGAQGTATIQTQFDGFYETLFNDEAYADRCELLVDRVCNWKVDEVMAAVEDWMQAYPDMNCIVAMSDEMALAAIESLKGAGKNLDEWVVVGKDGSSPAISSMEAKELDATVLNPYNRQAENAVDYTIKVLDGTYEGERDDTVRFDEFYLITQENVGEFGEYK